MIIEISNFGTYRSMIWYNEISNFDISKYYLTYVSKYQTSVSKYDLIYNETSNFNISNEISDVFYPPSPGMPRVFFTLTLNENFDESNIEIVYEVYLFLLFFVGTDRIEIVSFFCFCSSVPILSNSIICRYRTLLLILFCAYTYCCCNRTRTRPTGDRPAMHQIRSWCGSLPTTPTRGRRWPTTRRSSRIRYGSDFDWLVDFIEWDWKIEIETE